jgi:hypothetical protein
MTTANEEFLDLMPHRIRVTGETPPDQVQYDDEGEVVGDPTPFVRTYACLITDTTTILRGSDGREQLVSLSAFVAPVPLDVSTNQPVDIESEERIEILSPRPQERPLVGIERFYDSEDGEGQLHNIVLRFT